MNDPENDASLESRDRSDTEDLSQSAIDAVPSQFLNRSFQDLISESGNAAEASQRYQMGPEIGVGGIGNVFRVFDSHSQRPLALKTLQRRYLQDPAAVSRFMREGLLTGTLQHPGIPPVYDHGKLDDGSPYFTMKLVQGETLHELLSARRSNGADLGTLIGVFQDVAQTIAYAHSQQIIHRDLKPQNIMVGRFGEIQVMDWGLAKSLETDADELGNTVATSQQSNAKANSTDQNEPATDEERKRGSGSDSAGRTPGVSDLTTAGDIVGTPGYMAPEQARGQLDAVDARADVFALGAILFQILFGKTVFAGDSRVDVIAKTRRGDLSDALAELDGHPESGELVQLCRRCLAPDPSDRPRDASEVAEIVSQYVSGLESRTRQAEIDRSRSEVRMEESRKRQHVIVAMVSAVALISLVAAGIITLQYRKADEAARAEADARAVAEQAQQIAESETKVAAEINELLNEFLASNLPERLGYDVTLREVVDALLPEFEGRFKDRPEVEGEIRKTLGKSYRALGEDEKSEQQYRLSIAAFERVDPPDPLMVLVVKDRLAGVLRASGYEENLAESETLRSEVLRERRRLLGNAHHETLAAMNNLANTLSENGKPGEAETLLLGLLDLADEVDDPALIRRDVVTLSLADCYYFQGKFEDAEPLWREVINDDQASGSTRDNATVHLGQALFEKERHAEAAVLLRRAFDSRRQVMGPLHPSTLSAMRKLTRAMVADKQFESAIEILEKSVELHTEARWEASSTVCEARSLMATSLLGLDRIDDAKVYLDETVALLTEHLGEDHEYTAEAISQRNSVN